jgi:hypothetical protein
MSYALQVGATEIKIDSFGRQIWNDVYTEYFLKGLEKFWKRAVFTLNLIQEV